MAWLRGESEEGKGEKRKQEKKQNSSHSVDRRVRTRKRERKKKADVCVFGFVRCWFAHASRSQSWLWVSRLDYSWGTLCFLVRLLVYLFVCLFVYLFIVYITTGPFLPQVTLFRVTMPNHARPNHQCMRVLTFLPPLKQNKLFMFSLLFCFICPRLVSSNFFPLLRFALFRLLLFEFLCIVLVVCVE